MPAQIGADAGHPASLAQLMLAEFAMMQTSGPPATQCWTQVPDPQEPQVPPSVPQVGRVVVVLVVDVRLDVVVAVTVVVDSQSMSS